MVESIKSQRRAFQSKVFTELAQFEGGRYCDEASLNAFIGSKAAEYIDLKDAVIKTPMEYKSRWLTGLKRHAEEAQAQGTGPRHIRMLELTTGNYPNFKKYMSLFLEGSFLKHYEEHYKEKPKVEESEFWFGQNNDEFGFLVTPRFKAGQWENDKSEIRHFARPYWTISHLLETGLCYMGEDRRRTFSTVDDFLQFLRDLLRRTGSPHQLAIADKYIDYVTKHSDQLSVPVLIPELRYDPHKKKHEHRLDFLIVNPWSLEKYGFELSPWSTHGALEGANQKMADYNRQAKANFEGEMRKHKKYWRKFGVTYVIYTDEDLVNIDSVWEEIRGHLEIAKEPEPLELALLGELE